MGFLLFISKACQALSASACRASPPLHQETSPCGDPNTPDYETLGKKQSGCDLSTEPITGSSKLLHPLFNQGPNHPEDGHLSHTAFLSSLVQSEYNGESCYEIEHIGPLMSDLLR